VRSGAVACIGEKRNVWRVLKESHYFQDLGSDGRVILKYISRNHIGGRRADRSGCEQRQEAGFCDYGNEPSSASIQR
jgi:hypothetical protein